MVASAQEIRTIRDAVLQPDFLIVTPGIARRECVIRRPTPDDVGRRRG